MVTVQQAYAFTADAVKKRIDSKSKPSSAKRIFMGLRLVSVKNRYEILKNTLIHASMIRDFLKIALALYRYIIAQDGDNFNACVFSSIF